MPDPDTVNISYGEDASALEEKFFMDDLKERKLFLDFDIGEDLFKSIGYYILRINKEDRDIPPDKRKPIKLYITSDGGSVIDGLTLINIMQTSLTPIYTISFGQQYSMAFYIGLCGTKRFGASLSSYLIHDGSVAMSQSSRKARDAVDFNESIFEKLDDIVTEKTHITREQLEEKSRIEWYMFAPEAKELGIIDYIIGEDCTLSEVV